MHRPEALEKPWAVGEMKCARCGHDGPEIHAYPVDSLPCECHVCGEMGMWPKGEKRGRTHRR